MDARPFPQRFKIPVPDARAGPLLASARQLNGLVRFPSTPCFSVRLNAQMLGIYAVVVVFASFVREWQNFEAWNVANGGKRRGVGH